MKFNLRKKLQINDFQEYIENRYKNAGVGIRVSQRKNKQKDLTEKIFYITKNFTEQKNIKKRNKYEKNDDRTDRTRLAKRICGC